METCSELDQDKFTGNPKDMPPRTAIDVIATDVLELTVTKSCLDMLTKLGQVCHFGFVHLNDGYCSFDYHICPCPVRFMILLSLQSFNEVILSLLLTGSTPPFVLSLSALACIESTPINRAFEKLKINS